MKFKFSQSFLTCLIILSKRSQIVAEKDFNDDELDVNEDHDRRFVGGQGHLEDLIEDVSEWKFEDAVTNVDDYGQELSLEYGWHNVTFADGRAFVGEWADGCPSQGSFHIPPRDTYR
jgi:hypothetical protein